METIRPYRDLRRVYCAGPLFNAAERHEMEQIAEAIAGCGFVPFLPHAEVQFVEVHPLLIERGLSPAQAGAVLHDAIFALDVYGVVLGCGSLVFNLNGRVPDEGAVAEATMAWMLGKPMVYFKSDSRSMIEGRDNPIVAGQTRFKTVDTIDAVGPALEESIRSVARDPDAEMPCPAHLAETLRLGSQFQESLDALGSPRLAEPLAEIILGLFGIDSEITARSTDRVSRRPSLFEARNASAIVSRFLGPDVRQQEKDAR
jgi:nucleoside 2-deoxyribosyltransferase